MTPAPLFLVSGAMHFVKPRFFLNIMPPGIPRPKFWVAFTGVCEILGGIGLLLEPTRAAAGWALIALLVCVFPANWHMFRKDFHGRWNAKAFALAARLPLQGALIYWVYASSR